MLARLRRLAAAVTVAAAVVCAFALPAMPGAGGPTRAEELRREGAELAAKSRSAVLELYAIESRLARARTRVTALRARTAAVERQQATTRKRLAIARRTITTSERLLAARLRALYEQGETDALAIVLGASSLDEAVSRLDGLRFAAEQDRRILDRTRTARRALARFAATLRTRRAELTRLHAAAVAEAQSLGRAHSERAAYLERLTAERRLKSQQLEALKRRAAAAVTAPRVLTSASAPAADAEAEATIEAPRVAGAGSLTVVATGYALGGVTATGLPVGWGVVAVDPALIPLGTRMTIPGYGTGVAADTGGGVRGAEIDLWFPSHAQALAWGRRTVTITLH